MNLYINIYIYMYVYIYMYIYIYANMCSIVHVYTYTSLNDWQRKGDLQVSPTTDRLVKTLGLLLFPPLL